MKRFISKFENWFYMESIQRRLLCIGFIVIYILIFALNYFFPIYADDMMYSLVKYGESVRLIENLQDTGSFLWMYYFEWGGRVVAHIVAHFLLLFDKLGQDLINSLIFCILVYLSYRICIGKRHNIFVFIFLAVSFFYFTPSFLSSAIWKTGSANYLWMTTLTLAFIYPYINYDRGKVYKNSRLRTIGFLLFGILASWTNENLGPVLFLIIIYYLITFYIREKKVPYWALSGIIGVIIGCSLMILAPGNAVRAASEGYPSLFSSFDIIVERLPSIYGAYKYFMLRPILIYLISLVLFYYFYQENIDRRKVLLQSLLFFVIANISIWITVLSPTFPPRAFMSITVLTIIAIGILYANINFRQSFTRIVNVLFLGILIFYASIDYMTFLKGTYFLHNQMKVREQKIDEAKAKGETAVEFEAIHLDYRFEYSDFANYYKDYYKIDARFVEGEEK